MAPHHASPYPLWPMSLVCHLLVLPVQCIVYTWSWHQTSDRRGCHCISCGSNWNNHHRKWNLCQRPWDTCHSGICQIPEAHQAPAPAFHEINFCEGVRVPVELYIWKALTEFFPGSLVGPVIQAQFSSIIADRILTLDMQVFASHLVGEVEKANAARWRIF